MFCGPSGVKLSWLKRLYKFPRISILAFSPKTGKWRDPKALPKVASIDE